MVSELKGVNVPLTAEHLQAIGRICALWSSAENVMEHLIWAMIPTSINYGRAITTHAPNEARVNMIHALANEKGLSDDIKGELKSLTDNFNLLRDNRNEIVHSSWGGDAVEEIAHGYKPSARGTFRLNTTYWSAVDISEVGKDIEDWIIHCVNLCERHFGWPPLLPVSSPSP